MFNKLNSTLIGLDDVLASLTSNVDKYPFYDIFFSKQEGANNRIELAVAGFSPEELSVYKEADLLIVEGKKESTEQEVPYFRSISKRSFKRSFMLGVDVDIDSVALKHGILTIKLKQVMVEPAKKLIPITSD